MKNTWLVARRDFLVRVRSRGFLISSILVPLILIIVWAATGVFSLGSGPAAQQAQVPAPLPAKKVGLVDEAGLIKTIPESLPAGLIQQFDSAQAARQALAAGEIQAYYLIPPDYLATGKVERVSEALPAGPVDTAFLDPLLIRNLFPQLSPQQVAVIENPLGSNGPEFVSVAPPSGSSGGGGTFNFTPFLITFIIIIPLFTSGGYLLQSLGQEKSSRIMEILLISLRPRQLLVGKLLGLGALTLVQYLFWFVIVGIALLLVGQSPAQLLSGINLSPVEILYMVLFALGGYALYAGFMAGLGALAPNMEGGRSWVLLISLPMMTPIYLWVAIVESPNGLLATALSLFPLTAPVAMMMRMTTTTVAAWQIGLSLALLALTAAGIILLMGRLFRAQTLLSGEALSLQRLWSAIRA